MHIPIRSHRIYLSGKAASAIVLRRLHASQLPPSTTFSSLIARLTPPAIKRALSSSGPQRLAPVPAKGPAPAPAPATPAGQRLAYAERQIIYHVGTGRTIFVAWLKLTTIFLFVFFGAIVTPSFLASHEPWWRTTGVFLCGTIPLLFVAYTTHPFVTAIHIYPPRIARASPEALRRFARGPPPAATRIDISTLSLIGKPRVSEMVLGDLVPAATAGRGGGIANLARDTRAANAVRPWWRFPAVARFWTFGAGEDGVRTGWVWRELRQEIERREGAARGAGGRGQERR